MINTRQGADKGEDKGLIPGESLIKKSGWM